MQVWILSLRTSGTPIFLDKAIYTKLGCQAESLLNHSTNYRRTSAFERKICWISYHLKVYHGEHMVKMGQLLECRYQKLAELQN